MQQALVALKNRPKPSLPMPSKRSSVLNRSPDRNRDDTDSSSEGENSIPEERIATPDREYNYPRDHLCNSKDKNKIPAQRDNSERRYQNSNVTDRRPQNMLPPVSYSIHMNSVSHFKHSIFCSFNSIMRKYCISAII